MVFLEVPGINRPQPIRDRELDCIRLSPQNFQDLKRMCGNTSLVVPRETPALSGHAIITNSDGAVAHVTSGITFF